MEVSLWPIIVVVVAGVLAGCSALEGGAGVGSPNLDVDVTVRDAQGADVKCVWSSKLRVVSCPALSLPDKASGTDGGAVSNPLSP